MPVAGTAAVMVESVLGTVTIVAVLHGSLTSMLIDLVADAESTLAESVHVYTL